MVIINFTCCMYIIGCREGSIRLAGGRNSLEGRVEVCHDGVWGSVCNTRWSTGEALIACRQLGHSETGQNIIQQCQNYHLPSFYLGTGEGKGLGS